MEEKNYKEYCKIINETHIPANASKEVMLKNYDALGNWIFNNTPRELYKFRTCNNNNINAFRNQQIWFATGSKMNDDFDSFFYVDLDKIFKDLNDYFTSDGILLLFKHIKDGGVIPDKISEFLDSSSVEQTKELIKSMKDDTLIFLANSLLCLLRHQ